MSFYERLTNSQKSINGQPVHSWGFVRVAYLNTTPAGRDDQKVKPPGG
jgi:hypothetical protein